MGSFVVDFLGLNFISQSAPVSCRIESGAKFWIMATLFICRQRVFDHRFAAGENVLKCSLEIACIPGVCHVASAACVRHQKVNLSLRVRWDYASYPVEIQSVHTDDAIEPVIVFAPNLSGCLVLIECYAVLP